ncbi:MAG: DUF2325 domain-containing protein [Firmicutes bacterium]|nr:DUF2325 domain-containing protein [Bacillota bacterium]
MLELDKNVMHVLRCCEKENISLDDILAFSAFASIIQSMPPDLAVNILECLITIPDKKNKAFREGCSEAQQWLLQKLAKRFYKKAAKPEKIAFSHGMDPKIVQLVKHAVVMVFLQQSKGFILDIFVEQQICKKPLAQLLFNYSVLYIAQHDPEIREKYSEKVITKPFAMENFLENVRKLGKMEILKAQLESVALKTGCFLYDQNNSGKNKLMHVAGEGNIRAAYLAYVNNVERAALQAIDEISLAENKLIAERERYSKEIAKMQQELSRYKKINSELQRKLKLLQKENTMLKKRVSLHNHKVLVVGDTCHKDGYREIVEGYGGSFLFVDGAEEPQKTAHEAKKADIIMHVTAYGKHVTHDNLKQYKNICYVNNAGLSTFRQALENQVRMLQNA